MGWITLSKVIIDDKIDHLSCDTRDFFCFVSQDVSKNTDEVLEKATTSSHIQQDEIVPLLTSFFTATGGKGNWRFLSFENGIWQKYLRFYRLNNTTFVLTDRNSNPLNVKDLDVSKIDLENLNFIPYEQDTEEKP